MIAPSDAPTKKVSTPHQFGLHGKKKVQEQGQWPLYYLIRNIGKLNHCSQLAVKTMR